MTDDLKSPNLWSRIQGKLRAGKSPSLGETSPSPRFRFNWRNLANRIQSFDLQKSADWVSKKVQDRGFAFYGKLATIIDVVDSKRVRGWCCRPATCRKRPPITISPFLLLYVVRLGTGGRPPIHHGHPPPSRPIKVHLLDRRGRGQASP